MRAIFWLVTNTAYSSGPHIITDIESRLVLSGFFCECAARRRPKARPRLPNATSHSLARRVHIE
ncbi:hypothetical protein C0Z19_00990 [Trinickia soli]|uniref:Uncharacterized protein n=1 Tax=Trinickia soli TaxID=380675 RepID=A0A2N7WFU2_9BURK|nr:hypothetical protein CIW54_08915 [Paraburkholderia sp. T12-10]PMS28329.1 hypothetical protein C0Z19_00990 [Trinickia soli]